MEEITAQEVCNWLEGQIGNSLTIQKKEQQDIDQIEFALDNVGLMGSSETFDSYILPQTIVLRGNGSIETEEGQMQKLPEDVYEIPFIGIIQGIQNENGLMLQTERAYYSISQLNPQNT
ncbi:hypothetical protein [Paenibacillus sp. V4I5]|uniref:hypothetical protein n=1 Tax=Paenibacillus sp. V4I5 TaxID=3042306 RepID=UPI002794F0AA|nr:hypothetical protein [Paenibacillus sp. V4I5]MDQ0914446.1 hypothetical protein [Paenibacillus sp. V4I5]